MALKMALTRLPKGGDRFLWDFFTPEPEVNYSFVLKFDPNQPRDPKGTPTGGRFARTPIEQKRRDFQALLRRVDREGIHLEKLRVQIAPAWQAWAEDTKNRKKPLKADGAAAKKLDSYKKAKAIEDAFHAAHDVSRRRTEGFNAQARELLKVAPALRSKVEFKDNPNAPLHPNVSARAKQLLQIFKQFDGSGTLVPLTFQPEYVAEVSKVFGDTLVKNPDGSASIPTVLTLSKSETGRAYAGPGMGIALGGGRELEHQVYHEVAHHVEMRSQAVLKAAVEFRESRAVSPREVYKLNTLKPSLGDDEVAVRGDFADPYTAKVYPHDVATEIVSTGMESYILDPVRFARDRPEHFNLIFDIMQGKYRDQD